MAKSQHRQIIPQAYKTMYLELADMQLILAQAPMWHTEAAEKKIVVLTLPMPDGSFQDFRIAEAPVMHPALAAQFPMIKTYAGIGIDDPLASLRFDLTQKGFHAMIRTPNSSTVFIDPYSTEDADHYISYYKKDFYKNSTFKCFTDEIGKTGAALPAQTQQFEKAGDCIFRTYILALACTGEYATYHGGTTALALAAMTTTLTRVNGVLENDLSIHLELHQNTADLIFLDPATDPFTNSDGYAMLNENQVLCDGIIGSPNYDMGHVFSTGGGGVAYLAAVCNPDYKAKGVTGLTDPIGDPYDIDYVAHEIGHQLGGSHTQNNNCNRNNATAMEPGSGSTIMGYAGVCSPNVQNHSDDYYHAISLQEIGLIVMTGTNGVEGSGGNTCSTNTTFNNAPTADAGPDYTIPKSTPFVLSGTGTDSNGDSLTFTWEQMDNQTAPMPPLPTNNEGPAFRSFKGTGSPLRYLPRLEDLVNNTAPAWEVLSSVARTYNWRLTVRDNHIGGGCTAEDNMTVTVSNNSGPLLVTAPNTAVTWPALSTQTVSWDVANTTAAPVSCTHVDILLSVDGGFTYPFILATATPNDGSHLVTVPDNQSGLARIMVKGSNNIFFDISDQNFTIGPQLNEFTLQASPEMLAVCAPASTSFQIEVGATGNFNGDVTLSASGIPAGASAAFTTNPVNAPGSCELQIQNTAAATPGAYEITIAGVGSSGTKTAQVMLTVTNDIPAAPNLSLPANNAQDIALSPSFSWAAVAQAASYRLQVSATNDFVNLNIDEAGLTASSYTATAVLEPGSTYFWRVKAENACGEGVYSTVFSFKTTNLVCNTFTSSNVPITIPPSGKPTVTSTLAIPASGTITDLNVSFLHINHTYINDLVVSLKSPVDTERTLLSRICGSQNNILISLDDDSSNPYNSIPCPPNGGTYRPYQTLAPFNGQDLNGTWTLTIKDRNNQDGGSLEGWSLQVCFLNLCEYPTIFSVETTQPTCASPQGAILIDAEGVDTLEYSIDNGSSWQASQTFANLGPGEYQIVVRLQSDPTCMTAYAGNPVTILAAPAPPSLDPPVVTQPTCASPLGAISVNASGSGALEYSIDNGSSWQASQTFANLGPSEYQIVVRLQSDPTCMTAYAGNPVTILAAPAPPSLDPPVVTQPTCASPLGAISVNASGSGALEYSIDNGSSWQASQTFANLGPGEYQIVVRLQSDPTCMTAYAGNPVILTAAENCCPATLAIDDTPIADGVYQVELTITSHGTVPNSGSVVFKANESVELQPGFEVVLGGVFEVVMEGCTP